MTARPGGTYIASDGQPWRVEVDRAAETVTFTPKKRDGLIVGEWYKVDDTDTQYRLFSLHDDGEATFIEACPAPYCFAPVTHRSLHDIPTQDMLDEIREKWAAH